MEHGDQPLSKAKWEDFAQALAQRMSRKEAYVHAYGDRKNVTQKACFLLKNEKITDRVSFLSGGKINIKVHRFKRKPNLDKEFDLKSVIKTCREVIETTESNPQKMQAIDTLNKLGVFDNENKDDGRRMDPGAICEYLARFAGAPAKELAKIPGGLAGLMKRLMELTGTSKDEMKAAIDEIDVDWTKVPGGEEGHQKRQKELKASESEKKEDAALDEIIKDHPGPDGEPVNERLEKAVGMADEIMKEDVKEAEKEVDFT